MDEETNNQAETPRKTRVPSIHRMRGKERRLRDRQTSGDNRRAEGIGKDLNKEEGPESAEINAGREKGRRRLGSSQASIAKNKKKRDD